MYMQTKAYDFHKFGQESRVMKTKRNALIWVRKESVDFIFHQTNNGSPKPKKTCPKFSQFLQE